MSLLALGLVLTSAFFHAGWNLVAKKVSGGIAFIQVFTFFSNLIYTPLALYFLWQSPDSITAEGLFFAFGNGLIHIFYFWLLSYGYRIGDLSLVYPLARGTGPMFSTLVAVVLLGERPSPLALAGIAAIGLGVMIFSGGLEAFRNRAARGAIGFAMLTGLIIAVYTIWDKYAVSVVEIQPVIYDWSCNLMRSVLLVVYTSTVGGWGAVKHEWQTHRREAFLIGLLSPLAYMLVLVALTFSPVSYIAPAREISILIGAVMGARLLAEGDVKRRLMASGIMMAGLVALALG